MAIHNFRPSNGVSFGLVHVVTAGDATDNAVELNFQVNYPLVASILVVNALNVNVPLGDAVVTYPANGVVRIASGTTFDIVAGTKISVIAQRATVEL